MRIIAGKHKGRKIVAPKKLPSRPTTDMAKESLFNILNNYYFFESISVIDLFAGTGNISYEFDSRGTKSIVAVDQNRECIKFIQKTSQELGASIQAYKWDVFALLNKTTLKADIIFADPPYNFSDFQFSEIVNLSFKNKLLTQDGMLIIEHSKHTTALSNHPKFSYAKRYGGSVFSFFEAMEAQED